MQDKILPVGYNYQSVLSFQWLKTLPELEKPQELVAKRTFPVSGLQYAAQENIRKVTILSLHAQRLQLQDI